MGNKPVKNEMPEPDIYPEEEGYLYKVLIEALHERSGAKGAIYTHIFQELFELPKMWSDRFLETVAMVEDCRLSCEEMYDGIRKFVHSPKLEQEATLFRAFDCNSSGLIEYDEFALMIFHLPSELSVAKSSFFPLNDQSMIRIFWQNDSIEGWDKLTQDEFHNNARLITQGIVRCFVDKPSFQMKISTEDFGRFLESNAAILEYFVWKLRKWVSVDVQPHKIKGDLAEKRAILSKKKRYCCHNDLLVRRKTFIELYCSSCIKTGQFIYCNKDNKTSITMNVILKNNCLFIISENWASLDAIIPLNRIVAMEKPGFGDFPCALEIYYDGPEASNTMLLYSRNILVVRDWIKEIEQYTGFTEFSDKYEEKEEIGKGKYSVVKICTSRSTREKFAVKKIARHNLTQKEKCLLANEIEILKKVNHHNVVHCYDIIESHTEICIVTEILNGGTLSAFLQKNKRLDEFTACYVVFHILQALRYLHYTGVIHRDIKPENIMLEVDAAGRIISLKIIDFGLSCFTHPGRANRDSCGTPAYIAPEIVMRVDYGYGVDMWSLGVLTYFLLCGKILFSSKRRSELMKMICEQDVEFDEDCEDISKEAQDFVHRLLSRDKALRFTADQALTHSWITINYSQIMQTKYQYMRNDSRFEEELKEMDLELEPKETEEIEGTTYFKTVPPYCSCARKDTLGMVVPEFPDESSIVQP